MDGTSGRSLLTCCLRVRGFVCSELTHHVARKGHSHSHALVCHSVASHAYHIFLRWHETRTDVTFAVLSDPLHRFFEPVDCSLALSVIVYGAVVLAFRYSMPRPDHFFEYMQTHTLVITLRMLALYLTPLEAPPGTVPLVDPIAHPDGAVLVRDLFYSGHTAATFTIFIGVRRQDTRWRLFFGLCCVLTAVLVVLMKAHYVIDVLAAPCFVHSAHSLVVTARETAVAWFSRPSSHRQHQRGSNATLKLKLT
ncbi:hypothetical protein PINS_up010063 [Pythium insidiosum]|nr:hypothetical protein PINS_up010063 [Pythium insidiosum]